MTLKKCIDNYDVRIYHSTNLVNEKYAGWYWQVTTNNGCYEADKPSKTAAEAEEKLTRWLRPLNTSDL